jgi:flavin reductase (DIM6/NTAB) family NADH-FMN oxidoreductase RutF
MRTKPEIDKKNGCVPLHDYRINVRCSVTSYMYAQNSVIFIFSIIKGIAQQSVKEENNLLKID